MDMKDLNEKLESIRIPDSLDNRIHIAIKKGEKAIKHNRIKNRLLITAAAFLLVFTSLTAGINYAPAFAAQLEQLPGGPELVKLLRFNNTTVEGGEITDGKDIESIDREKPDDKEDDILSESINIKLGDGEGAAATLSHYEVTYNQYPYSAVVYFSGVREFSAIKDLMEMEEGPLVKSIYRLITLDDSAHRFAITFKKPVTIEVVENSNPASLTLNITEDPAGALNAPIWSLRSKSLPFGEQVGSIEEILRFSFGSENARLLQDSAGTYLAEEGYYNSEEEAQARMDEIISQNPGFELVIEKRTPDQIPSVINE